MPDYRTVTADYTRLMNKHFTPGRGGQTIQFITRHHNGGVSNTDQTWNTWQTREASAHYQIETTGRVGQLVNDRDTAWANGDSTANARTIAIEHSNDGSPDYGMTDATVVAGGKWAGALCWFYKLGRPNYGTNIRDHRNFYGTACPYHLANGGKYHARWMKAAQDQYDLMTNGTTPTTGALMALTDAQQKQLFDRVNYIFDQLCGPGDSFGGWSQTGSRTAVDTIAAIAAKVGVPNTRDTKAS
ncbi:N-acetylmuramoyl-L-alanine amidase [Tsukamurella sp. DT100]|uniref:N-acetylmuramoyl-L-alanine amidase n=1 Tax=Tsukamurella sp. DT100 TaxID=3393415 RepID=UPI003CEFA8B2